MDYGKFKYITGDFDSPWSSRIINAYVLRIKSSMIIQATLESENDSSKIHLASRKLNQ